MLESRDDDFVLSSCICILFDDYGFCCPCRQERYAGKFLEAVQKNDPGVVVSVVKQTAPRCQVFVPQLKPDFFAIVEFKIKTRNVTVCLSGENACSGQPATVDVK